MTVWAHQRFCHSAISQFSIAISFVIARKKLKIAQIAQIIQLFQLLNSKRAYGDAFWVKSYANVQECKQWRQQRFAYCLTRICAHKVGFWIASLRSPCAPELTLLDQYWIIIRPLLLRFRWSKVELNQVHRSSYLLCGVWIQLSEQL